MEVFALILLVYSKLDVAGVNIAECVLRDYPFVRTAQVFEENPIYEAKIGGGQVFLVALRGEAVQAQYLTDSFKNVELVVFISRHSSQSGVATLSVHTPGNFGAAGLGGLPRCVSVSPVCAMATALRTLSSLRQELGLKFEVSYECTHHGPSLGVPTMFVELGSCDEHWRDKVAAGVVARAAMEAVGGFGVSFGSVVLGVGGTHYNSKFTSMALGGEVVFGHMVPKYAVSLLDREVLLHCVERTFERVGCVVLDWKGIRSEDKPGLMSVLGDIGLSVRKV